MPHAEFTLPHYGRTLLAILNRFYMQSFFLANIIRYVEIIFIREVINFIITRDFHPPFGRTLYCLVNQFLMSSFALVVRIRICERRRVILKSVLFLLHWAYAIFRPICIQPERNWVIQVISISKLLWKQRIIDRPSDFCMMLLIQSIVILFGFQLGSRR